MQLAQHLSLTRCSRPATARGLDTPRRVAVASALSEQHVAPTPTASAANADAGLHGRRAVLSALTAAAMLTSIRPARADEEVAPATTLELLDAVASEEAQEVAAVEVAEPPSTSAAAVTASARRVFFDVAIEGEPVGRIVVELFEDVKAGSNRFADLSVGKQGVGYRLSRIDGIFDTHLRVEGVKRLSYSATGESRIAGGDSVADLEAEMESPAHTHDQAGLVSLMVKEATERPIQEKLIAKDGKLVTIQLQAGEAPNGTGFMITRGPAPALDRTNLVVGRVVEGQDVIDRVAALPYSRPRQEWYDGPFFQAGKAMGDKRATVAEKGFNRPFKRVIITTAGLLA